MQRVNTTIERQQYAECGQFVPLFFHHWFFISPLRSRKTFNSRSLLPPGEENARAVLDKSPGTVSGSMFSTTVEHRSAPGSFIPNEKTELQLFSSFMRSMDSRTGSVPLPTSLRERDTSAVAPDLISGFGPNGGGSSSVSSRDSVVMLVHNLSAEETFKRLGYVRAFAVRAPLPANGECATVGFCWGGGQS